MIIYVRNDFSGERFALPGPIPPSFCAEGLDAIVESLARVMRQQQYELMDAITRGQIAAASKAVMDEYCTNRQLANGMAWCDDSNNPPATVHEQIILSCGLQTNSGDVYKFSLSHKPL